MQSLSHYQGFIEQRGSLEIRFKFFYLIGNLAILTGVLILLAWTIYFSKGFSWTHETGLGNYHIILLLIFIVFVQANASIVFRLAPFFNRTYNKLLHVILHFIAVIGISIGFYASIKRYEILKVRNFYSLHGWISLIAIGLYYLQFFIGLAFYFLPCFHIPESAKSFFLPLHKIIGRSLLFLSISSVITGIIEKAIQTLGRDYMRFVTPAIFFNCAGIVFLAAGIIFAYLSSERFRLRQTEKQPLLSHKKFREKKIQRNELRLSKEVQDENYQYAYATLEDLIGENSDLDLTITVF